MLLEVRELVAGYGRPVFGPVSFVLGRGEILGLVGPNGCGKSTLLSALLGGARCFSGEVRRAEGITINLQTQRQPELEGVPLSGRELLALTGATASGLPQALLGEGAGPAPVDGRLDRLSGGQRQFLHLWACLQAQGDVVLLDEPTNNLDPAGVAHLAAALRKRAAAGAGLIVVSHDERFVASVCERSLRLGEGAADV
jgi:ATPase subunit of ABC transporter with duplicated ATPase domains